MLPTILGDANQVQNQVSSSSRTRIPQNIGRFINHQDTKQAITGIVMFSLGYLSIRYYSLSPQATLSEGNPPPNEEKFNPMGELGALFFTPFMVAQLCSSSFVSIGKLFYQLVVLPEISSGVFMKKNQEYFLKLKVITEEYKNDQNKERWIQYSEENRKITEDTLNEFGLAIHLLEAKNVLERLEYMSRNMVTLLSQKAFNKPTPEQWKKIEIAVDTFMKPFKQLNHTEHADEVRFVEEFSSHLSQRLEMPELNYGTNSSRCSIIVAGPPGVGKSYSVTEIAKAFNYPIKKFKATDLHKQNPPYCGIHSPLFGWTSRTSGKTGNFDICLSPTLISSVELPTPAVVILDDFSSAHLTELPDKSSPLVDHFKDFLGPETVIYADMTLNNFKINLTPFIFVITTNVPKKEIDPAILDRTNLFNLSPLTKKLKKNILLSAFEKNNSSMKRILEIEGGRKEMKKAIDLILEKDPNPGVRKAEQTLLKYADHLLYHKYSNNLFANTDASFPWETYLKVE